MKFINDYPDDVEWSDFIALLNEWSPEDRQLRHIVQFVRSGQFYPADMYVDLIRQYIDAAPAAPVWCASGEEGIEFSSEDRKTVEDWITTEMAGEGHADEPVGEDYYQLVSMTRAELEVLPEV